MTIFLNPLFICVFILNYIYPKSLASYNSFPYIHFEWAPGGHLKKRLFFSSGILGRID